MRGRELLDVFPIAFLPKDHALAIAIMSYNGGMNFGLLGDYDALADIDAVAAGIEDAIAELVALAGGTDEGEPAPGANGRRADARARAKT
jgi:hypothetical protein